MSSTKKKGIESNSAEKLGPDELTLLGEFTYALLYIRASKPFPLPSPLAEAGLLQDVLVSESLDMLKLGEWIQGLSVRQEEDSPQRLDFLFWKVLIEAIHM